MAGLPGIQLSSAGSGSILGALSPVNPNTYNPQATIAGNVIQNAAGPEALQPQVVPTPPAPAPVQVDPWAGTPWGSKANHDKALGDFNAAKNNAYGSITDLTTDTANKYNSSILDYLDQFRAGQRAIDRSSVQNELARSEGRMGVLDMVGTGLKSGGVMLNNAGAANSSAGEQLGKAYSDLGRKELSKVGNQFVLGQENIKGQQDELNIGADTFKRKSGESKVSAVNAIVQTASQQLAQLNAAAQSASLPDRIAIEQEKVRIRNEALSRLTVFDATLNSGIAGTTPASADTNRIEAQRLLTAGTAPENSFNYTSSIPAQFQGSGPFASALPIFTGKRRDPASVGA